MIIELTLAEKETIRVALSAFALSLNEDGLGDDDIGILLTENYLKNISTVMDKIFTQSGYGKWRLTEGESAEEYLKMRR